MNIEWLKNKTKEKFYPITHAKAVLFENSNKTLDEEISDINNSISSHTSNTSNPHNVTAEQTPYDNATSGLSAQNVQDAVDEVSSNLYLKFISVSIPNDKTQQILTQQIEVPTGYEYYGIDYPEYKTDIFKNITPSYDENTGTVSLTKPNNSYGGETMVFKTKVWFTQKATKIKAIDELNSNFNNLEIGGRNLYYLKDFDKLNKANVDSYSVSDGEILLVAGSADIRIGQVLNSGDTWTDSFSPLMDIGGSKYVTISISNPLFEKNYYNFLDSDKKALSNYGYFIKSSITLEVPDGAKYLSIRVGYENSVSGTEYKLRIKVEKGNKATDWTPAPEDIENDIDEKVGQNGYGEVAGGKNLVNPKNIQKGKVVKFTNGDIINNKDYFISGFIPVSPGKTYTKSGFSRGAEHFYYDSAKNPFEVIRTKTFTAPDNAAYVILSGNMSDGFNCQLEEGSVATDYEPYYPSNKMLAENKADKSEVTTNLLKPTFHTETQYGVTCTNNGDGTYTLNGTATGENAVFIVNISCCIEYGKTYRLVGCPQSGGSGKYGLEATDQIIYGVNDYGDGAIFNPYETGYEYKILIVVYMNHTANNLVFKPMLTTNLNATYDDFVPFTGTTGQLNSDVAELEKSNEGKMDKENPTGTGAFSMNRKADTTVGENSTTEGNDCTASGNYSHAEGLETNATQERAHAEGYGTNASGYQAHTEGHWTVASGQSSHAEGESTLAQGYETHAEGNGTKAIGNFCHVEGHNTTALSDASHSEGSSTNRAPDSITSSSTNDDIISAWNSSKFSLAKGAHSHVEGCDCLALGDGSHAEGSRTKAVGDMSHSGGCATEATGRSSCAIGEMVSARYDYQTAIGILNHNKEENIFEVGNGISDSTGIEKSNALELTRTGDLAIAGDFYFTDAKGNKISMRDILTRLTALEPGFSVDVEG